MTSYYDTIPNFKYWDIDAWKEYVQKYIVPIYETSLYLVSLGNKLYFEIGVFKRIKTLKEVNKDLIPFFVGGIDENGNYKENSLARLIYLMYGIYVEPKEVANIVKEVGEEGFNEIKIKLENEYPFYTFYKFLYRIKEYSFKIIEKLNIDVPKKNIPDDIQKIIQNPDKILDLLKELYKACVSFSANYNYYTFFILSSYGIHWKYLVSAYPKLNEHFEEVKEFLGFTPIFIPYVNNPTLKKDYTIWAYEKESIGNLVFYMQLYLWHFFDSFDRLFYDIFKYIVEKPENLKETYKKLVKKSIGDEFEEITIDNVKINLKDEYLFIIDEKYIVKWPKKEIVDRYYDAKKGNLSYKYFRSTYEIPYENELSKPKILLFDFLNKVAPILFLKLAIILPNENIEYLEIPKEIFGRELPILIFYGDFLNKILQYIGKIK